LALQTAIETHSLLSFGDGSWNTGDILKAVEVLAAVPEDANDFNVERPTGEISYTFVESLFKKKKQVEISKWNKAIGQANVYIFDPAPAVNRLQTSETYQNLAEEKGYGDAEVWLNNRLGLHAAMLVPPVWLHAVEITDYSTVLSMGSVPQMFEAASAFAKSCRNMHNLRRQLLYQQHLYLHILDERPPNQAFDDRNYIAKVTVRLPELVVSIARPFVMDEGQHQFDIPLIDQGRLIHRQRLAGYQFFEYLPEYTPGEVRSAKSKNEFRVQLADVAAGRARYLYEKFGAEPVVDTFPVAYLNGRRLTKDKIVLATGSRGGLIAL